MKMFNLSVFVAQRTEPVWTWTTDNYGDAQNVGNDIRACVACNYTVRIIRRGGTPVYYDKRGKCRKGAGDRESCRSLCNEILSAYESESANA